MLKKFTLLLFFGCSAILLPAQSKAQKAIYKVLGEQEKAWNMGDIAAFMQGYWHDDSLRFIGASGLTFGWQQTFDNYKKRYPDAATMGQLKFTILSVDILSRDDAFVVGKWHLTRKVGDIGGHFTLLWRKIAGKWVIVADHTS